VAAETDRLLVWQFYWIGGTLTSSDYLAKAYAAYRRLTGREDDSAVIVISTKDDQTEQAGRTMEIFLEDNYAAIHSQLMSLVAR
jgi:EpsI family protein